MRKIIDVLILIVSVVATIFGVSSLLTVSGMVKILPFYNDFVHILFGYIIVVISMATGIMTFNLFATRRKSRGIKKLLLIGVTTYSTILTIPLVATFVVCLVKKLGTAVPEFLEQFAAPIYNDFISLFKMDWLQYVIFGGGIVMGLIFIAVPIIMCVSTLKKDKKLY